MMGSHFVKCWCISLNHIASLYRRGKGDFNAVDLTTSSLGYFSEGDDDLIKIIVGTGKI